MGIKQVVDYYEHNGQTYQETRYIEIPMFKVYYQVDEQTAKQFDLSASDLTGRVGNEFETVEEAFEFIAKLNSTPGAMGFHPFYRQARMWVTDENGNMQFKDLTAQRIIFTTASKVYDYSSTHEVINPAGKMVDFMIRGEEAVRLVVARDEYLSNRQQKEYEDVRFSRQGNDEDLFNKIRDGYFVVDENCLQWLRNNGLSDLAKKLDDADKVNEDGIKYTITISNDPDVDSPSENDGSWKPYSFNHRHNNYKEPEDFFIDGDPRKPQLWLRNKLRVGLAFYLSYYEHGLCQWSLAGEGNNCRWDSVSCAGMLVWEEPPHHIGAKTLEDRTKDARNFLEEYTDWCNGSCYYVDIEDQSGGEIDRCGGFIGSDQVEDFIQESLPEDATEENTEFVGDGAWIANYYDFFKQKEEQNAS